MSIQFRRYLFPRLQFEIDSDSINRQPAEKLQFRQRILKLFSVGTFRHKKLTILTF